MYEQKKQQPSTANKTKKTSSKKQRQFNYQAIFENSNEALLILNRDHFIHGNKAALQVFGLRNNKELKKYHPADLSPKKQPNGKDSRKYADQKIDCAYKKGFCRFSWLHQRKNEEEFEASVFLNKFINKDKKELLQVTIRDLQKDISHSSSTLNENLFKQLFHNMTSGAAIYQPYKDGQDFIFKEYKLAGQKMDKMPAKKAIGKKITQVFPGVKKMGLFDGLIKVYKTGKTINFPITKYQDKHLQAWRDSVIFKLESGEIATIYTDLTEQKLAEQKLKNLSTRLSLATDSAGIGIWELNLDTQDLIWDKQMYNLYGIKEKISNNNYKTWQQAVHVDDLTEAEKKLKKAIQEKNNFQAEFRIVWPDKSIHYIEAHAIFIKDKNEKMIGVNWDITKQKEIELKLKDKLNDLEKLNRTMVDRELKMIELKKKLKKVSNKFIFA